MVLSTSILRIKARFGGIRGSSIPHGVIVIVKIALAFHTVCTMSTYMMRFSILCQHVAKTPVSRDSRRLQRKLWTRKVKQPSRVSSIFFWEESTYMCWWMTKLITTFVAFFQRWIHNERPVETLYVIRLRLPPCQHYIVSGLQTTKRSLYRM
jgi:hypothetical protein